MLQGHPESVRRSPADAPARASAPTRFLRDPTNTDLRCPDRTETARRTAQASRCQTPPAYADNTAFSAPAAVRSGGPDGPKELKAGSWSPVPIMMLLYLL